MGIPLPAQRTNTGADLLDQLHQALTRYVLMPSPQAAYATVLWIAASHAQPAWAHAPRLVIRAPEKRCGKSRLLDVVEATCHEPFLTVNSSAAAVYRSISEDPPTMLVDEADTLFGAKADGNEDLRGLLNAGHQRNRPTKRYDAATNRVESIPTFAMAALAGIGTMPDTIEDRAIIVRMRRRAPGETVSPYRLRRDRPPLQTLSERLTEWLRGDLATLERTAPAMPLEDRAADTWEPLIIIADHAGGPWPDRARNAADFLLAETATNDSGSVRARLLADCRTIFGDQPVLSTSELLRQLNADAEAPWSDYSTNGLTPAKLSKLLAEYDIKSANVRFPDGSQAKGYRRADFLDAWTRYCPEVAPTDDASPPSQASHPSAQRDDPDLWDGSTRPADLDRPSLTSIGTPGTAGTAITPHTDGGEAA